MIDCPPRKNDKGEKCAIKQLGSFSFEAVKLIQSQYCKPVKKCTETLSLQSVIFNDSDSVIMMILFGKK